jgi:hypothetical protein
MPEKNNKKDHSFALIAIVAIVAIIAMIVLVTSSRKATTVNILPIPMLTAQEATQTGSGNLVGGAAQPCPAESAAYRRACYPTGWESFWDAMSLRNIGEFLGLSSPTFNDPCGNAQEAYYACWQRNHA